MLLENCRKVQPDVTLEEIFRYVEWKAQLIEAGRIKSPVGFLLKAVPEAMAGPHLARYREGLQESRDEFNAWPSWESVGEAIEATALPHGNGNGNGHA